MVSRSLPSLSVLANYTQFQPVCLVITSYLDDFGEEFSEVEIAACNVPTCAGM